MSREGRGQDLTLYLAESVIKKIPEKLMVRLRLSEEAAWAVVGSTIPAFRSWSTSTKRNKVTAKGKERKRPFSGVLR